MKYHAHIYYDKATKIAASIFLDKHKRHVFKTEPTYIGNLNDMLIDPHSAPMFQIGIDDDGLDEYLEFFNNENRGFSMLLHPLTGNEKEDHIKDIKWYGKEVPLNMEYLNSL